MWGGFGLGNISQLGSQLGEALQRAKTELDSKLDQTFTFDDEVAPRTSEPADDASDDFTVDASGLFIPTGRPQSKQAATTQKAAPAAIESDQAAQSAAAHIAGRVSQVNGNARQGAADESGQSTSIAATVNVPAQHEQSAVSGATQSTQPVKKKVIKKKVIRRVKADEPQSAAAAESHVQTEDQRCTGGLIAGSCPADDSSGTGNDAANNCTHHQAASGAAVNTVSTVAVPTVEVKSSTVDQPAGEQAQSLDIQRLSQHAAESQQQQTQPHEQQQQWQHDQVDVALQQEPALKLSVAVEQQPGPVESSGAQRDVDEQQQEQQQQSQLYEQQHQQHQQHENPEALQQLDQNQQAQHQEDSPVLPSYAADAAGETAAAAPAAPEDAKPQQQRESQHQLQAVQDDDWGDQELDLGDLGLSVTAIQENHEEEQQQQQGHEQQRHRQQQLSPAAQCDRPLSPCGHESAVAAAEGPDAERTMHEVPSKHWQQHQEQGEQQHETDTLQPLGDEQNSNHHQQHQQQYESTPHQQSSESDQQQDPDLAATTLDIKRDTLDHKDIHQQHVQQGQQEQEQQQGQHQQTQQQVQQGQQRQGEQQQHEHQQDDQQQQSADNVVSLLQQQCQDLQHQLSQREGQLARQVQRLGDLEAATVALSESKAQLEGVVAALTAKNEQLVLRASKVNEQEMEEVQKEAAERLAAAERKVFALIKERDALKRAAAASSASNDSSGDVKRLEAELQKKQDLVAQLMDEGQKLSIRQMELESNIKKLRQQLKASDTDKEKLNALLAAERAEAEGLRKAKARADRELVAAVEAGRQELEAVRQQGEEQLLKAQADKVAAEAVAAEAAAEGLAGQLRASEARAAALADSVSELQEALGRQRAEADLREEMMRQELSDLERRAQAAELRHQELSERLPEATAPLLRQITALQETAAAQAQAWAAAERNLMARVHAAEAAAATAVEQEAAAQDQLGGMQARLAAAEKAAASAKASAAEAATKAARANEKLAVIEQQLEDAQAVVKEAEAAAAQLRDELKQQELAYKRKLSNESAAHRAAEEELARTRQELSQLQGMMGSGLGGSSGVQYGGVGPGVSQPPGQQQNDMWRAATGPPALAAPGFKWVLVPEAADAETAPFVAGAAANGDASHTAGSVPETPQSAVSAGADVTRLLRQGSIASSTAVGGFFDASELLTAQSDAASASGAGGEVSAGMTLSPANSSVVQLHQTQLRAVQQRLGSGAVREAQMQRIRAALKQKVGECAGLEARVRQLEETRDQLAGELVQATQDAAKASDAVTELPKLQQAYQALEARYAAAVELVGERDEQLEELANDLEDVKHLYRQQIDTLLTQLAQIGQS